MVLGSGIACYLQRYFCIYLRYVVATLIIAISPNSFNLSRYNIWAYTSYSVVAEKDRRRICGRTILHNSLRPVVGHILYALQLYDLPRPEFGCQCLLKY